MFSEVLRFVIWSWGRQFVFVVIMLKFHNNLLACCYSGDLKEHLRTLLRYFKVIFPNIRSFILKVLRAFIYIVSADREKCPFISNGRLTFIWPYVIWSKLDLRVLAAVWGWVIYAARQRETSVQFNGESDQTHTFLNVYYFHTVLATDFIQTLNELKDFDL